MMERKLKEKLEKIPDTPGVYIMKDEKGQVIYVGKASSLSKRVKSYFTASSNLKNLVLTPQIKDIEVIPVYSESEALLLENRLIKEYQPKYNVNLKDGKSYPLVKITNEKFPSIQIVRKEKKDDGIYFGPFTNVKLLKKLVRFLRRYFPIRNCKKKMDKISNVCTQYHIGLCSGPCAGKIGEEEYSKLVEGIISFFEGKYAQFEKKLKKWMEEAIERWDFETAQKLKERLFLLQKMKEKFPVREEEELVSYGKENVLANLAEILNLPKIPNLIEGYDISNIGGDMAAGSKVAFKGGIPYKEGYRKFRIKTVDGIDDYGMLREVIRRRFDSEEERKEIPDLILVDGGKGQLNAVYQVLKELKLDIPVISLAKRREEIYTLWSDKPIILPQDSPVLHLLQRVRNEAHRFAIKYHKLLRRKKTVFSFLDEIKGVGEKRKKKLLEKFPDIVSLANAEKNELVELKIPENVAKEIIKKAKEVINK